MFKFLKISFKHLFTQPCHKKHSIIIQMYADLHRFNTYTKRIWWFTRWSHTYNALSITFTLKKIIWKNCKFLLLVLKTREQSFSYLSDLVFISNRRKGKLANADEWMNMKLMISHNHHISWCINNICLSAVGFILCYIFKQKYLCTLWTFLCCQIQENI